jgi:vanillate O-demethylase ferredoxin subunit
VQVNTLSLRVASVDETTPLIKTFTLEAANRALLPGYEPGAHIQVEIPASGSTMALWRSYSLLNFDPSADTRTGVHSYCLGVRREDAGRGGSRFMHQLKVGDTLTVREPVNHFPLAAAPVTLLIAGGIGITPISAMAAQLHAQKRDFVLHYSGRTLEALSYVDQLRAFAGERLVLHADNDPATCLSIDALINAAQVNQPIYLCGPAGMIDAVLAAARRRGWHESDLHYELFTEVTPQAGDTAFEVQIKSTGAVFTVPPDKSVLDVLLEHNVDVMYDCKSGYCGLCTTKVVSGEIDHRDSYLSEKEYAAGKLMQVCVSRCKGDRLVLDP